MKRLLFFATAITLIATGCSKEDINKEEADAEIPTEVTAAFQEMYPNVGAADWEKDGDDFVVEFMSAGKEHQVEFNANGNVLETEVEINPADLPQSITADVATRYNGAVIEEAEMETEDGVVTYEVEVSVNGSEVEAEYDANGVFIEDEVESDEDDDGDDDAN